MSGTTYRMGKWLWSTILYITNDLKYKPLGGDYKADYSVGSDYKTGAEFWEHYNKAPNTKYSYKWCLRWLKDNSYFDVWDELFMKDPYLKICCDKKRIRSFDQLQSYADEYWKKY